METPKAELSDAEALELLRRDDAKRNAPTAKERWYGASGLFVVFLLIAILLRIHHPFTDMYAEMGYARIGPLRLPTNTTVLLSFCEAINNYPQLFAGMMFVLSWIYFEWIAKRRTRVLISNWVLFLMVMLLGPICIISLFQPLIVTMDKIGK